MNKAHLKANDGEDVSGIHQVEQEKHEITRNSTIKQNQQFRAREKLRLICFLEKR